MSTPAIQELQRKVAESPSEGNYQALVNEEMAFLKSQVDASDDAARRTAAAESELKELRREVEQLRVAAGNVSPPAPSMTRTDYCTQWLDLLKEFSVRKEVLSFLLSYSAEDLKLAELTTVAHWLDTWTTFFAGAEESVRALKRVERNGAANAFPPTRDLYDALDEVCRLQLQARTLVGRERYRRSAASQESVDDFMDSQLQLKEWCHKQRDTLAELTSLEDLVEFSASFYTNVPVMDSNFLVLMEQSEALMSNTRVQKALEEVNQEWVMLTLETYDKMQSAASETHNGSMLERHCMLWTQNVSAPLRDLLMAAQTWLQAEDASEEAHELARTCESLLKEHDAHEIVCTHLADYNVREECVRPHSDALKAELQSSLTTTVLTFPHYDAYGSRAENKNRIEELQEWIDVNSQKGTYMKLLTRLDSAKAMIEEHADILFPDDTTAP